MKNFPQYIDRALCTEKGAEKGSVFRVRHAILGYTTEVGEALDAFKKEVIYGKSFDRVNFLEELGDCLWYLALGMSAIGYRELIAEAAEEDRAAGFDVPAGDITEIFFAVTEIDMSDREKDGGMMNQDMAEIILISSLQHVLQNAGELTYRLLQDGEREFDMDIRKGLLDIFTSLAASIGVIAKLYGSSAKEVMDANIAKLEKRYGGAFTKAAAIDRDTSAEREILDAHLSTAA